MCHSSIWQEIAVIITCFFKYSPECRRLGRFLNQVPYYWKQSQHFPFVCEMTRPIILNPEFFVGFLVTILFLSSAEKWQKLMPEHNASCFHEW